MIKVVPPDEQGLKEAVKALENEEVVAYPTETVYGLAVNPFSEKAIKKLFEVKGREENKPILVVIGALTQLDEFVSDVSDQAKLCIQKFWPGPLSLVLPKSNRVSPLLTGGGEKVCVRWTSHPIAQKIALEFGRGITSTSANRSGEPPAVSVEDACLSNVAVVVDGGRLGKGEVSTVFDPDTCTLYREGVIKKNELESLLGREIRVVE